MLDAANREVRASQGEKPDFLSAVKNVGGIVEFGHYEQDNDLENGAEPIEWVVLDVQDGKSLLISKYAVDTKSYNWPRADVTWKSSSIRQWLYQDFLREAFTGEEQNAILVTEVDNSKSQGYSGWDTNGGLNTQDRVFLLSYEEANNYFESNDARCCEPTDFVKAKGAYVDEKGTCGWWLRSPGSDQSDAARVSPDGSLGKIYSVYNEYSAVRPVLWISHEKYKDTRGEAEVEEQLRFVQKISSILKEEWNGKIVTFGFYEQDNDLKNGPEPIEWIVLDVQDGKMLLLSKYGLDCQPYNISKKTVTWETCTLRSWLNNDFLDSAFSDTEKKVILEATVDNSKVSGIGWSWNTSWEPNTQDKVFLLSYTEAKEYFASDEERICRLTEYADSKDAYSFDDTCWWWLRSIRTTRTVAYAQGEAGGVKMNGTLGDSENVDYKYGVVRPAVWINLEAGKG